MTSGSAYFTVTGEFLTQISRQLWADEQQPEKAINLLEKGLHGITLEQVFLILTGQKQLIGDSSTGIELIDDTATVSLHENSLDLLAILKKFREREDRLEDQLQFSTDQTELVSSQFGLIEVPRRQTISSQTGLSIRLKDNVDLEKIPYRVCTPEIKQKHCFSRENQLKRENRNITGETNFNMLEEQDLPPSNPPKPEFVITTDNGWLSPSGEFYQCNYGEHISLAYRLGHDEIKLEKFNWIKVQNRRFWNNGYLNKENQDETVTQKQRDLIFDYCIKHKIDLPLWM
jgi:hypothetical protein